MSEFLGVFFGGDLGVDSTLAALAILCRVECNGDDGCFPEDLREGETAVAAYDLLDLDESMSMGVGLFLLGDGGNGVRLA